MNNPKPTSKRNSLTAFKQPAPILPTSEPEPVVKPAAKTAPKPGRKGPKPKPASEKRDHRVLLSFTKAEGIKSKEKAGLAGEATAIYAFLQEHGYFK